MSLPILPTSQKKQWLGEASTCRFTGLMNSKRSLGAGHLPLFMVPRFPYMHGYMYIVPRVHVHVAVAHRFCTLGKIPFVLVLAEDGRYTRSPHTSFNPFVSFSTARRNNALLLRVNLHVGALGVSVCIWVGWGKNGDPLS